MRMMDVTERKRCARMLVMLACRMVCLLLLLLRVVGRALPFALLGNPQRCVSLDPVYGMGPIRFRPTGQCESAST